MKTYRHVLSIAGFDGSGGAGLQADLKTCAALECYGLSVLTALPVQSSRGVIATYPIAPSCVKQQLSTLASDVDIHAVKIGILHRPAIVEVVEEFLSSYRPIPVVLDPVMAAKSGDCLSTPRAIKRMKSHLFPLVTVLTPNLPEASLLLGRPVVTKEEMAAAARQLTGDGPAAVVIKGGHFDGNICEDCLYLAQEKQTYWFSSERIDTKNTHGTGCTFSTAIASGLARGNSLLEAVKNAKEYVTMSIRHGSQYMAGKGNGPVHHLYRLWR